LAKKELKLPCRLGRPADFSGLEDELAFSTVCGLVLRGADFEGQEVWRPGKKSFTSGKGVGEKIKKFLKIFLP